MHINQIQENLKACIEKSLKQVSENFPQAKIPPQLKIELDIPKDYKYGDLTTNLAMRMAKTFSLNSLKLAELLKDKLEKACGAGSAGSFIDRAEVSRPGFVNFWFSKTYLYSALSNISGEKRAFGKNQSGKGVKTNIEFVSANPTGPLTVAHGRQAAVGDAIARLLEFSGYNVCREYLINDVGVQIELLGKSIHARYLAENGIESEFPKDGYQGEYIREIAKEVKKKYGKRLIEPKDNNLRLISEFGVATILNTIKADLEKFGVIFDKWFSQKKISPKIVKQTLDALGAKGYIYKKDGATWFKSTAFGDDKDRVVIKSDGAFTYLAPDIAYHCDKHRRKFRKLIDIWGPDHHGYVKRLVSSLEALGHEKGSISVLIVQLATLFRGGVALSMSTRRGEFITLKEVVDEVGSDVTKFFFLMRKLDSHLDFDLEVAKKSSHDNPVYYIQYAHARIASIFTFSEKLKNELKKVKFDAELLNQPEELLLLRMLCEFPVVVEKSASSLEPYRMVEYLNELAKVFHSFYTKHRVVTDEGIAFTKARLELVSAVKIVLANGLSLLGVSLPERM